MHGDGLLCELHAHTAWSDGSLTLTELVDLYGRSGFDVLCVTDHALPEGGPYLTERVHAHYVAAIEREAKRAREVYDLLLVPGLELTFDGRDTDEAGHALALGLRSWVALDRGLEHAVREARDRGSAIVAAHPHGPDGDPRPLRTTRWFWRNRDRLVGVVDRWELFNRAQTFGWIADVGLPPIASGDFHRLEHLESWKTIVPCRKSERALLEHLRSDRAAYVVPWQLRAAPARVEAA